MEAIFEGEFIKINLYQSNAFLEIIWTTTVMMQREAYREILKVYLKAILENQPNTF